MENVASRILESSRHRILGQNREQLSPIQSLWLEAIEKMIVPHPAPDSLNQLDDFRETRQERR